MASTPVPRTRPTRHRWAWSAFGIAAVVGLGAALAATSGDRADMAMAALGTLVLIGIGAVAVDAFLVPPIERGAGQHAPGSGIGGYGYGGGGFSGGGDGGGGGGGCGDGGGGGGGSC